MTDKISIFVSFDALAKVAAKSQVYVYSDPLKSAVRWRYSIDLPEGFACLEGPSVGAVSKKGESVRLLIKNMTDEGRHFLVMIPVESLEPCEARDNTEDCILKRGPA